MDKTKSMLTIKLKLYKPSLRKRSIIDSAMFDYTRACQFLLDIAEIDIEAIQKKCIDKRGKYRASNLVDWIDNQTGKRLNEFNIEPFKDSIKIDVASILATYLTAKKKDSSAQFPVIYSYEDEIEQKYDEIMSEYVDSENIALEYANCIKGIESTIDNEKTERTEDTGTIESTEDNKFVIYFENRLNKLIAEAGKLRPIFFCRYATNRNYSILFNPMTRKYYAKIYLMNVKSKRRIIRTPMPEKVLFYIDKEKEIFNERIGKKSYVLFPLSFGKWQEKFLQEAILKPEILKTARLIKTNNEYFLSINIALEKPDLIQTDHYMGVSRGIKNLVNYSVVDNNGRPLLFGNVKVAEGNIEISRIHEIANSLIEIAKENKSKVILEKLLDRNDGLSFVDKDGNRYSPAMDYNNYNKLSDIMEYKMSGAGLPTPIRVSAINLFCTCTNCGKTAKANRFSKEMLICTKCGMTMDVEKAGSENLAKRLLKYNRDKIKVFVDKYDGKVCFVNKELNLKFVPANPFGCADEFKESLDKLIKEFYINIDKERLQPNFKKKCSLIKKLENSSDILNVLQLE